MTFICFFEALTDNLACCIVQFYFWLGGYKWIYLEFGHSYIKTV